MNAKTATAPTATAFRTLRPGFLVSLKTTVRGNVSYEKEDLDEERVDVTEMKTWRTKRTIEDTKEFEAAKKARGRARTTIRRICSISDFGLLCPEGEKPRLDAAVAEAHRIENEFNAKSRLTSLTVNVICGYIAADDVEAVKAINSEVRNLIEMMKAGVAAMDVKRIRQAASDARQLRGMLTPDAAARVQTAIDTVRAEARRLAKAGDEAAAEVDRTVITSLTEVGRAFIEIDADTPVRVSKPQVSGRAVDLIPASPVKRPKTAAKAADIEV